MQLCWRCLTKSSRGSELAQLWGDHRRRRQPTPRARNALFLYLRGVTTGALWSGGHRRKRLQGEEQRPLRCENPRCAISFLGKGSHAHSRNLGARIPASASTQAAVMPCSRRLCAGAVPKSQVTVIDGVDQRAFFEGKQETSNSTATRSRWAPRRQACYGRHRRVKQPASILCFGSAKGDLCKNPISCVPSSRNQMQRSVPSLCTATTVILGRQSSVEPR